MSQETKIKEKIFQPLIIGSLGQKKLFFTAENIFKKCGVQLRSMKGLEKITEKNLLIAELKVNRIHSLP